MNQAEKDGLFKLFGTMKNDKFSSIKGIGLGLCISKMIVEAFDGSITVESEPDKGSSFTYKFIIHPED